MADSNNLNSVILIGNSVFPFTEEQTKKPNNKDNAVLAAGKKDKEAVGQLNYYTQNKSNVTVFLNGSDIQENNMDNFPFFFNSGMTVDFPFLKPQKSSMTEEDVKFLGRATNGDCDPPEYIDINSLVLPSNYFPHEAAASASVSASTSQSNNLYHGQIINLDNNVLGEEKFPLDASDTDDEVVFVKAYKQETPRVIQEISKVNASLVPKKVLPEPRRNPRRQVQMQKVSYDLATKLSWEGCFESTKFGTKEIATNNNITKRPQKNPLTVSLKASDFKEWPVDGMHEKPTFNPATKKIEKHPNGVKKTRIRSTPIASRKRATAVRKRTTPTKKATRNYASKKSFATMAHHNLHYFMSFVNGVKKYKTMLAADCAEEEVTDNLEGAKDMLDTACVLYCLANDVSESSLAKYVSAVAGQDNVTEFVDCVVDGCKANVSS